MTETGKIMRVRLKEMARDEIKRGTASALTA
jgi:acyl-coenzyme A synthetase/AMP-(fatty) acid ligase